MNELADIIIQQVKQENYPPIHQIQTLIEAVGDIFLSEPNILEISTKVKVFSQCHGIRLQDGILKIITACGDPSPKNYYLLLGIGGRSPALLQCIFALALKLKYPKNFYIIRGKCDCAHIHKIYGLFNEFKKNYNVRLWKKYNEQLANNLPFCAIIFDQYFATTGGGLSPECFSLDQIKKIQRPTDIPDYGILCDIFWSKPDAQINEWDEYSPSYGSKTVAKKLEAFGLKKLICSPYIIEEGVSDPFFQHPIFLKPESIQKIQLICITSTPNHLGEFDNYGGLVEIVDFSAFRFFQFSKEEMKVSSFEPFSKENLSLLLLSRSKLSESYFFKDFLPLDLFKLICKEANLLHNNFHTFYKFK